MSDDPLLKPLGNQRSRMKKHYEGRSKYFPKRVGGEFARALKKASPKVYRGFKL